MIIPVLHKESAGSGEHSGTSLESRMRQAGFDPVFLSVKEGLKQRGRLADGAFVVVAGGDGTVRRAALELAHTGVALAILPVGTANNIAKSLGIPSDLDAVIAGWRDAQKLPVDLGVACGPWGRKRFLEGVGVGLLPRTIERIESLDEISGHSFESPKDKLYRDACVLAAMAHEIPAIRVQMSLDEGAEMTSELLLLEVLNIGLAGPGVKLAARTNPSDGVLDVISVSGTERSTLTADLRRALSGDADRPQLNQQRARRVRLRVPSCALRLDDELLLHGPASSDSAEGAPRVEVSIEMEPGAVTFLLPA